MDFDLLFEALTIREEISIANAIPSQRKSVPTISPVGETNKKARVVQGKNISPSKGNTKPSKAKLILAG